MPQNAHPAAPAAAPLERRRFLRLSGGALLGLIAAAGCGSGGGSTPLPLPPATPGPVPTPAPTASPDPLPTPPPGGGDGRTVVKPEVRVLPADGSLQLAQNPDGTVSLRGALPEGLAPGAVLVSGAGAGLLRRVTAVRPAGPDGAVVVETVQGTLEDVFVRADFAARIPIDPADVERVDTVEGVTYLGPPPGVGVTRSAATRGRDKTELTNFEFAFKSNSIHPSHEAEWAGKAKLKLELELDGKIEDGVVQGFTCVFHITPEAEAEFVARKKFTREFFKQTYATVLLKPIVFAIGPVPVVIVPKIDLSAELVGAFEGGVSFTCAVAVPSQVGAVYTAGKGWEGVGKAEVTGNLVPKANAFATLKAEFNPARVDIQTHLYGVAGPEVALIAPSFEVEFGAKGGSDNSVKFGASVAAKANLGVEVEVVGKEVAKYKKERALELKFPLHEKTFLPGSAELEVS